jgi:hypothetical protein
MISYYKKLLEVYITIAAGTSCTILPKTLGQEIKTEIFYRKSSWLYMKYFCLYIGRNGTTDSRNKAVFPEFTTYSMLTRQNANQLKIFVKIVPYLNAFLPYFKGTVPQDFRLQVFS